MLFEFVCGPLPFGQETDDQLDLFREILEAPIKFPNYVKDESAINLISGFLERSPELRLGAGAKGHKDIQEHAYYESFDWDIVLKQAQEPPWKPDMEDLQTTWEEVEKEKSDSGSSSSSSSSSESESESESE